MQSVLLDLESTRASPGRACPGRKGTALAHRTCPYKAAYLECLFLVEKPITGHDSKIISSLHDAENLLEPL